MWVTRIPMHLLGTRRVSHENEWQIGDQRAECVVLRLRFNAHVGATCPGKTLNLPTCLTREACRWIRHASGSSKKQRFRFT